MRILKSIAISSIISLSAFAGEPADTVAGSVSKTAQNGYSVSQSAYHRQEMDPKTWDLIPNETMRYVHLNMAQFYKADIVARSGAVSTLKATMRPEIGAVKANTIIGKLSLDTWVKTGPVDGFLVIDKGVVVYEKYPRMRSFDKHHWWSTRKSIFGTLIAMLEEDGKIDVSKSIDTYITDLKDTAWAGIPIIDILDMASGTAALEVDEPNAFTDEKTFYYQFEAAIGSRPALTDEAAKDVVKNIPTHRKSGEAYEYTTVNTFVLGWLLEVVTGQTNADLIRDRIWQHIGAEADAIASIAKTGENTYFSTTLRDMARYGLLFTPSWNTVSSKKIISDSYLDKIHNGGRPEIFSKGGIGQALISTFPNDPIKHNSYQWDFVMPDGDFAKLGHNGQGLYISPDKNVVVAFFGSGEDGTLLVSIALARAIAKSLDKK